MFQKTASSLACVTHQQGSCEHPVNFGIVKAVLQVSPWKTPTVTALVRAIQILDEETNGKLSGLPSSLQLSVCLML